MLASKQDMDQYTINYHHNDIHYSKFHGDVVFTSILIVIVPIGFSTGADIRTSYNDITSGGECISDNLKLAIAVRGKAKIDINYIIFPSYHQFSPLIYPLTARDIITTENEDIFTDNVSDTASSDGIAISNQDGATTTTTSNKMSKY